MKRLIAWISDLRVAIGLLILIAAASGLGTFVPQKEAAALYHRVYDCLLYTSPSPRDRQKSRMPSSA